MSAAFPPKWVLMEPFVSHRDYDKSFPDESKAPIRTSGTTSWNAPFSVAFKLEEPPAISRLYAYMRGFPRRQILSILTTHQHLSLFCVGKTMGYDEPPVQDLFIFNASDLSLNLLPHCTLCPLAPHARCDGRVYRSAPTYPPPSQRKMPVATTGLLCRGKEFVVAGVDLLVRGRRKNVVYADIVWLRSSSADYSDCNWSCARTRVLSSDSTDDFRWQMYTVIPFRNWLCWIDYTRGILFGDMFGPTPTATPTVTLVRLPPEEEFGSTHAHPPNLSCRWMYRGVSAIDTGSCLKFIKVDRHDGVLYGPLKDGAGFTITCHTLLLNDKVLKDKLWEKDYSVTSNELWSANPPEDLPRDILMFPQVNIDRPHVLHFLYIEKSMYAWKKMWVVTIDMNTKKVESFNQYINGMEARGTEDADLVKHKSLAGSMPFLPCGFSEFLHL